MRVPGVACAAAKLEPDAEVVADGAETLAHHGGAALAEAVNVKLVLVDAGAGAAWPLGLELVGGVGDGEGVVGGWVLALPELLGELELAAADVAPGTNGV